MGLRNFYRNLKIQGGLLNTSERIVKGYLPTESGITRESMKKLFSKKERSELFEEKFEEKKKEETNELFEEEKTSKVSEEQKTVNRYEEQVIKYLLGENEDFQKLVVDKLIENINEIKEIYGEEAFTQVKNIFTTIPGNPLVTTSGNSGVTKNANVDFKNFYNFLVKGINANRNVSGFAVAEALEKAKEYAKESFQKNTPKKVKININVPKHFDSIDTEPKEFNFDNRWEAQKARIYVERKFISPKNYLDEDEIKNSMKKADEGIKNNEFFISGRGFEEHKKRGATVSFFGTDRDLKIYNKKGISGRLFQLSRGHMSTWDLFMRAPRNFNSMRKAGAFDLEGTHRAKNFFTAVGAGAYVALNTLCTPFSLIGNGIEKACKFSRPVRWGLNKIYNGCINKSKNSGIFGKIVFRAAQTVVGFAKWPVSAFDSISSAVGNTAKWICNIPNRAVNGLAEYGMRRSKRINKGGHLNGQDVSCENEGDGLKYKEVLKVLEDTEKTTKKDLLKEIKRIESNLLELNEKGKKVKRMQAKKNKKANKIIHDLELLGITGIDREYEEEGPNKGKRVYYNENNEFNLKKFRQENYEEINGKAQKNEINDLLKELEKLYTRPLNMHNSKFDTKGFGEDEKRKTLNEVAEEVNKDFETNVSQLKLLKTAYSGASVASQMKKGKTQTYKQL